MQQDGPPPPTVAQAARQFGRAGRTLIHAASTSAHRGVVRLGRGAADYFARRARQLCDAPLSTYFAVGATFGAGFVLRTAVPAAIAQFTATAPLIVIHKQVLHDMTPAPARTFINSGAATLVSAAATGHAISTLLAAERLIPIAVTRMGKILVGDAIAAAVPLGPLWALLGTIVLNGYGQVDNAATLATHRVKMTSWIEAMHKSVQDNHQRSVLLNAANAIANISWVFWAKQLATGAITAGALAVLLGAGIKLVGGAIRMRARRLQILQG